MSSHPYLIIPIPPPATRGCHPPPEICIFHSALDSVLDAVIDSVIHDCTGRRPICTFAPSPFALCRILEKAYPIPPTDCHLPPKVCIIDSVLDSVLNAVIDSVLSLYTLAPRTARGAVPTPSPFPILHTLYSILSYAPPPRLPQTLRSRFTRYARWLRVGTGDGSHPTDHTRTEIPLARLLR